MTYVVVPIKALDISARHALAHARSLGTADGAIVAVCVADTQDHAERLRQAWDHFAPDTELVIIEAPPESAEGSLLAYVDILRARDPSREVTVMVPEDK